MKINQMLSIIFGVLLVMSTATQAQSARDNTNFIQQQEHEQKMRLKKERAKAARLAKAEAAKAKAEVNKIEAVKAEATLKPQ